MRKILFFIIFLMCCMNTLPRKTIFTSASGINNHAWIPGDTVVMKNGTWTNQAISFIAKGTQNQPVVLEAETPGKVMLTGTSRLSFGGSYIIISGLYFLNGTLSGSPVVEFRAGEHAFNSTLKNCAIINYNPGDKTVDSKWVSLFGKNNTVDHCSFENKTNSGTLLVVWLTSGVTVNHNITNNYFGFRNANVDENGSELNGQEIIRVGDSSTSMTTANVTVSGNIFEKCNGEIEIISNKSCGNLYKNNLFLECRGMLTLRHGNNCTVEENYFFGNGVAESGGVRIIGENHRVYNNYFDKLRGTGYRAAICMVRGKENSLLNEYFQVKNALVAFNTMVDCAQSFSINYNSSESLSLPPITSVIAHNNVYNTTASNTNVIIDQNFVSALDVNWKNNLMNQGKYTNFIYSSSQVITGKDPGMRFSGTNIDMYEPAESSVLMNYKTTDYPEIQTDIRGRIRNETNKVPGASQLSGIPAVEMPVKKNTGAGFFNYPGTKTENLIAEDQFSYRILNENLSFKAPVEGKLCIYQTDGKSIYNQLVMPDVAYNFKLKKEVYLLKFFSNNLLSFHRSILIY